MKVLVVCEERYRCYRLLIAEAIANRRPHLHLRSTALGAIETALEGFDPHVVLCSRPNTEYPNECRAAWVELPVDPTQAGDICLNGEHEEILNPDLAMVLSVLDEAQEQLERGALRQSS
jgi:hypothetical protein